MTRPLWAPWRLAYVGAAGEQEGCVFCREVEGAVGEESLVVHRAERTLALLNKYPYASGHLLVAPLRHVGALEELEGAEWLELHRLTVAAIAALRATYRPDAFNVGWNLGEVAGGSIAGHLHQHVVPRWSGDANFLPIIGRTKTVPQLLDETRALLAKAWDTTGG